VSWEQHQPEPVVVVVPVARGVVVAVRRPAVPGVVVPATAAHHPVGAFRTKPQIFGSFHA